MPPLLLVLTTVVASGCGSSGPAPTRQLGPTDFVSRAGDGTDASTPADPAGWAAPTLSRPPLDAGRFVSSGGANLVPPPSDPQVEASAIGPMPAPARQPRQVLFDVKVGEVNNKPIFAAEFLDPVAQRLRAMAYEDVALPGGGTTARVVPRARWRFEASRVIQEQLEAFVQNELVIAEGMAVITPAERTGLRFVLSRVRDNLARGSGGSITRAVRELGTGQTLSEYVQEQRNRELIYRFSENVRRSVFVTRSDVERAYLQKYGGDRRESSLSFRRIRVPKDNIEGIARVSDRLASGESFAEVAADEANTSRRSSGGLWPPMTFSGPFEDATFFANAPTIDEALRSLTPGEWAGPLEDDRWAHWIFIEDIEIGYKTWAEAQSELREELLNRRFNEAISRAMAKLRENANMTDLDVMHQELLDVATEWFYPDA